MSTSIDKIDVVEALAEVLDDSRIDGLGAVLAAPDGDEWGTLVLQTWPDGDDRPSVDFLLRVTRYRQPAPSPQTHEPSEQEQSHG